MPYDQPPDRPVSLAAAAIVVSCGASTYWMSPPPMKRCGARPMRRAVERYLEDPLAEEILKGVFHDGEPIFVTMENDRLVFTGGPGMVLRRPPPGACVNLRFCRLAGWHG